MSNVYFVGIMYFIIWEHIDEGRRNLFCRTTTAGLELGGGGGRKDLRVRHKEEPPEVQSTSPPT